MDTDLATLRRAAAGHRTPEALLAYTHALFRSGQGLFLLRGDKIAPTDGSIRVCFEYAERVRPGMPYDNGACTYTLLALLDLEHYLEACGQILDLTRRCTFKGYRGVNGPWERLPGTGKVGELESPSGSRTPYRGGLKRIRLLVPGETCPHCFGEGEVVDTNIVPHRYKRACPTCEGQGSISLTA